MKIYAQPMTRNPISEDGGTRHCRSLQKELIKVKSVDLGTANGLQLVWFMWINPVFVLRIADTLDVIGYMELDKVRPEWGLSIRYYQSGVFIRQSHRNRKLGTVLYLGALHVFNRLVSDPIIGIDAVRTWKAIEKYGYKVHMWDSNEHQEVPFVWSPNGEPIIHGRTMDKYKNELLFYV